MKVFFFFPLSLYSRKRTCFDANIVRIITVNPITYDIIRTSLHSWNAIGIFYSLYAVYFIDYDETHKLKQ